MVTNFSAYAQDNYFAPHLSRFRAADIPDTARQHPEAKYWVPHFILNTLARANVPPVHRELRFHFLRRTMIAFDEYDAARSMTLAYLNSDPKVYAHYFSALHHWEHCLAAAWHAIQTLRRVIGLSPTKVFTPRVRTVEERLHNLYTAAKHYDSQVTHGKPPDIGTVPVWLEDDGPHGVDGHLTFYELAQVLEDLAAWAYVLEDPLASKERLEGQTMQWAWEEPRQ